MIIYYSCNNAAKFIRQKYPYKLGYTKNTPVPVTEDELEKVKEIIRDRRLALLYIHHEILNDFAKRALKEKFELVKV